jgi:capsular polysaccharide biosynthesis protein
LAPVVDTELRNAPPPELLGVTVNYEGLMFRRGRIHPRSFAREFDSAHYRRPSRYAWFLVRNYMLRRSTRLSDAYWVIDNFSPRSYYHWMTECLPRLLVAERVGTSHRLLLPDYFREDPYVAFTLRAFPVIDHVQWIGTSGNVVVDRLVCPPRLGSAGNYSPEIVDVATRVSSLVDGPGTRRLYLSRAGATRRRISNEDEVARILEAFGFEALRVNPAEPAEQIRAARAADVLVGLHGAELTNVMFQRPGSRVLELRHRDDAHFFDCYSPLAERFGVEYRALPCDLAPGQESVGFGSAVNQADLVVDLPALCESLATVAPLRDRRTKDH